MTNVMGFPFLDMKIYAVRRKKIFKVIFTLVLVRYEKLL